MVLQEPFLHNKLFLTNIYTTTWRHFGNGGMASSPPPSSSLSSSPSYSSSSEEPSSLGHSRPQMMSRSRVLYPLESVGSGSSRRMCFDSSSLALLLDNSSFGSPPSSEEPKRMGFSRKYKEKDGNVVKGSPRD